VTTGERGVEAKLFIMMMKMFDNADGSYST
jgi:hypothetical protein